MIIKSSINKHLSNLEENKCRVLFLRDVQDLEPILDVLKSNRYDCVVSDCYNVFDDQITVPFFGAYTVGSRFLEDYRRLELQESFVTDYAANIFYNKKQMSRYLTLKLASLFDISFDYIWNGIGRRADMTDIIVQWNQLPNLLTDQQKKYLLSPITLQKKWIDDSFGDHDPDSINQNLISLPHGGNNVYSWNMFFESMMTRSAVSLINDTTNYLNACFFSWKTMFSILSLTFPIWVGGYKQASEIQRAGFDVFDDVIDHSYQHKKTLFERCWYAFELNKKILVDLDHAAKIRLQHKNRLLENRKKYLDGGFTKFVIDDVESWPTSMVSVDNKKIFIDTCIKPYKSGL